jgi:RAB6A-GEF complex partner protein 1
VALLAVLWQVFFPDTYFNYRPSASKNQASQKVDSPKNSLLEKTCDLLRNFPEYMDVVVSVARKTDGRHWADLFSTAGRSTE